MAVHIMRKSVTIHIMLFENKIWHLTLVTIIRPNATSLQVHIVINSLRCIPRTHVFVYVKCMFVTRKSIAVHIMRKSVTIHIMLFENKIWHLTLVTIIRPNATSLQVHIVINSLRCIPRTHVFVYVKCMFVIRNSIAVHIMRKSETIHIMLFENKTHA